MFEMPKFITKLEGSTVSLRCLANGFPYPNYRWVKREMSNNLTKMVSGQSLVLTNVTEKDDGVYACIASNAVGNDTFDVRLNVHSEYIINEDELLASATLHAAQELMTILESFKLSTK